MKTMVKKLYEAMFLVDSVLAASDWDGIIATIKGILQRSEAEIVSMKKWADRRLAYEINHKSKGTYILCYFKADGSRIREIERNVRLSERIMRVLILNAEDRTIKDVEKDATLREPQKDVHATKAESATGGQPQAKDNAEEEVRSQNTEMVTG